jgi:NADH dehydrogenase
MDTSHENREQASGSRLPHVVIIGGGFGGLYAARGLARAPVNVTVIDKHNHHLFRPMLYQVATGLLSSDKVAAPIRSILRRQKNVTVLMAEVVGVDTHARVVRTREGEVEYDYLILATGIAYNYFGHDEWKSFAPGLASVEDADRIRGKILTAFESAEQLAASGQADASLLHELLTFVQVGAGTAGVEMAGTMAEMARMALARDFRHIDPRSAHILLFDAAPRILPSYSEGLSEKARRHLERLGVEVRTNAKVERVDEHGVVVNGERIASRTVLWTAGVVASPAGRWLGADVDKAGRIKVNADLSVPGHPNVFAVGDTAAVSAHTRSLFGIRSKTPELLPGVAQVAIQGGRYVAGLIRRRVQGQSPAKPFRYWDKGNMAVVGRTFAVAELRHARFSGFAAWLLWAGVHIYFLIGFANRLLVMAQWAISFITRQRGVRILPLARSEMARDDSGRQTVVPSDAAFEPSAPGRPRSVVAPITTQVRGNEARSN